MFARPFLLVVAAALSALLLVGCATTPYEGDGKINSDALLQKQFEVAKERRLAQPGRRVIFAGFAMHSQSKAFRNDVLTAEKAMLAIDSGAIVFKLDNPAMGESVNWPYATRENLAQVVRHIDALAGARDKVVLLISTHGGPGVLAVNFSNKYYPYISPRWLKEALAPLGNRPTLLVLSACFSGSFLESLAAPNRVILTAAAKDRQSFGCQFHSLNTYFVEALMKQPSMTSQSIAQIMENAKASIDLRERDMKLSPPSSPQVFIGAAALPWAERRLDAWLTLP